MTSVGIHRVRDDWPGQRDNEGKHDNEGGASMCLHRDLSFTDALAVSLALAFLVAAGTQHAIGAFGISIGTLAAFLPVS